MKKLDALRALLAKVKAGEKPSPDEINRALMCERTERLGFSLWQLVEWIISPSDIRAMGGAMALHKAVLPNMKYTIEGPEWVCVYTDDVFEAYVGELEGATTPIFWLIAILKALIAQEEETP